MPEWAKFMELRSREVLEQQIFALMWQELGHGLHISYSEVLELPVARFDSFLKLRQEHLDRAARAMKGG